MKIVNEKGKLFGIINVIDLILLLCLAIIAFALIFKALPSSITDVFNLSPNASTNAAEESKSSNLLVTMRLRGAMNYIRDAVLALEPGEQLVAGTDFVDDTYLVSVEAIKYDVASVDADGNIITTTDPQKSDIIITIESKQPRDKPVIKIGSQEVRAGRAFTFKTQTVEVSTMIEKVEFLDTTANN